ncbi:DUF349 domain-containing protein [Lutibacter sp.]|uniref:DUF349 domain-containing protein n=1 Tax=Lutibacter sp. TaxID=1925666 RepID=UPI001A2E389B|nr:DUF349 domain-containing protein [Lutibacter sp.]MBI9040705.1 DUF349 domain-containing protein [Lutibacter sp.]
MLDENTKVPEENNPSTPQNSEENTLETVQQEKTIQEEVAPEESVEQKIVKEEPVQEPIKEEVIIEKQSSEPVKTPNKAIDEIDDEIAASSEKIEHENLEDKDYSNLSLEELVAELTILVKESPVQSIQNNVNNIKNAFNIKFGEILKKEKAKFLEEGGNIVDFQYSDPIKTSYNSILYDYKVKRNEFYAGQENMLKKNLEAKLALIEDLKHLIDNADGSTMYKIFKDIQTKWREIGPIPRAKYNDAWRTYHHHVERFYDLLHLNNDLRDLDFKHNLEEKLKLVQKAEELAEIEDVNEAFKELQVVHKLWKEEVGPVARNDREEVWNRFSEATKKIHDKRHEFFKDVRSKYDENVEAKNEIIALIEAIDTSKNNSRADWQKSIDEIDLLRNKFFSIGQTPRNVSDKIWTKFKAATKKFNVSKNKFFKEVKKDHLDNLNAKKELIEKAIALKDSEDWDSTTEIMKKIQADWKKIGHVPRKYSDKLWKEFKDACNHFFDRLHKRQDAGNKEQLEVFNEKKDILKNLKEDVEDDGKDLTLDDIKEYVNDWRNLGRVPFEMRHIEVKFNKLIDKVVETNDDIDKEEVEMIKFKILVNGYLEQKNYRKLDSEQLFVRKKVDESVKEIQQLENNLGFISNIKEDNPLVINVRNNINEYKDKLEIWKAKLDYLRQLEY